RARAEAGTEPQAAAPPAPRRAPDERRFAGFRLLPAERRLLDPAGAEVALTPMEFDLLLTLASNPGQVLTRDRLLRLTPGRPADPLDRSVDIRVTRLRRKLEPDPNNPTLIRTVRGQGYLFSPDG
ncbi:winged helix-turn-helix domain-containing protein, partial [Falsiroseomonas oryzae]|uniref:winged helix-turn-helix domain-containing protein n=1 Tax=Falsiroseomonas oryzae TaxID=2766473 RepID=UPI0022EA7F2E